MTIKTIKYDNPPGIEFFFSDVIYGHDIIDISSETLTPELVQEIKFKIVDLSSVTENYTTYDELKSIADTEIELASSNPHYITALISSDSLITSLSELYKMLLTPCNQRFKIFTNRKDAELWIVENFPSDNPFT